MKIKNLLYGSFLILSLSIITSFEKKAGTTDSTIMKCFGGTGEDGILYVIKTNVMETIFLCGYMIRKMATFK
jgi:hypothetical protein